MVRTSRISEVVAEAAQRAETKRARRRETLLFEVCTLSRSITLPNGESAEDLSRFFQGPPRLTRSFRSDVSTKLG